MKFIEQGVVCLLHFRTVPGFSKSRGEISTSVTTADSDPEGKWVKEINIYISGSD